MPHSAATPDGIPGATPTAAGRIDARRTEGRAVILASALRCFVRRGYHGTSIRDIASEAGMTSAALYHHFPGKQHLLRALMDRALTEAAYDVDQAVEKAGASAAEQLAGAVSAWALFHTRRRDEALVGATEIRSLDEENRRAVVALRDEIESRFRTLVERGVAGGELDVAAPAATARAILTMGTSIATWFTPGGPNAPESVAEQYVGFALRLVGAAPGEKTPGATARR